MCLECAAAALAVSFQLAFEDISDGSLNGDQSASVAQDIKDAILAYISPAFAGIKVTGNGLSTSNTVRTPLHAQAQQKNHMLTSENS